MKHLWTILLVFLLSACGAGATPGTDDDNDDGNGGSRGAVINQTAGVAGYPGATDVQVSEDGLDTRVRFAADATLEEVYTYFGGELRAQGWQRTGIETDDEIEADYAREGRELEFELEREDDGGFELEIDIDRDNAAYNEDDDDDDGDDDGDDA